MAENAREVGEYFKSELRTLPNVVDVRGMGLLVGIEFESLNSVEIKHICFDNKLLVTAIGSNIIRMVPPLIATKEDCHKAFTILKAAVEAMLR